jgi:hypothetical protein
VITVGAMKTEETYTRTDDLIASYSSKGPTQIDHVVKPDIVARVDGIEASADPLLELRAAVYLLSGRRRRQAP